MDIFSSSKSGDSSEPQGNLPQSKPEFASATAEIKNRTLAYYLQNTRGLDTHVIMIPVVVHVVYHEGNPAQNISEEQINSQIHRLSGHFRLYNPDEASAPEIFQTHLANTRLDFQLATVDPNGNPSNGITRTPTMALFFDNINLVKSAFSGGADSWDPERYLNIWVCQLGSGLQGHAQLPGGLAATDGVVITHTAFGTMGTAKAPFNQGRTAIEEIGHWLGMDQVVVVAQSG